MNKNNSSESFGLTIEHGIIESSQIIAYCFILIDGIPVSDRELAEDNRTVKSESIKVSIDKINFLRKELPGLASTPGYSHLSNAFKVKQPICSGCQFLCPMGGNTDILVDNI